MEYLAVSFVLYRISLLYTYYDGTNGWRCIVALVVGSHNYSKLDEIANMRT